MDTQTQAVVRLDPYSALRFRDFRLLLFGRLAAALGEQMVGVAIGWELYERTGNALALGLVGLVQVIPIILLSLPGGHLADRYNRKMIVLITQIVMALSSLGLAVLSFTQGPLALVYLCLLGVGIARAFNNPAVSTILPATVPTSIYTNAATWNSSSWQLASVIGPSLGGFLVALSQAAVKSQTVLLGSAFGGFIHVISQPQRAAPIYLLDSIAGIIFVGCIALIHGRPMTYSKTAATFESLAEGIRFMRKTKVILGAITLDMFAVFFGGATALMPVYAKDILHVGADGLGLMRAAPSIGALAMALVIANRPPFKKAGRTLLTAVAGFGIATIIFGLSHSFWLSVAMLALLGALDNISVVIRHTLVLVRTPDEMRGRVSAVNSIFIGASNELGMFESGVAAALLGPVIAVVAGGIGTILVVLSFGRLFPEMSHMTTLEAAETVEEIETINKVEIEAVETVKV